MKNELFSPIIAWVHTNHPCHSNIVSRINYKPNCPEKKIVIEGKNNNNKL